MATRDQQEAWEQLPEPQRYIVEIILLAWADMPREGVATEETIEMFLRPLFNRHDRNGTSISDRMYTGFADGRRVGFMASCYEAIVLTDAGREHLKTLLRRFQVFRMRVDPNVESPTEYDLVLQAMIKANPGREIYARVNNITMETQFLVKYASKEIEPNE